MMLTDDKALSIFNPLFTLNAGQVTVTPVTALSLPTVYSCINIISDALAWPDCELIREETQSDGSKIRTRAEKHPCFDLLYTYPNDIDTPFWFRKKLIAFALGWGNGYALIERNGIGRPVSVNIYHPTYVTVYTDVYAREISYKFRGKPDRYFPRDVVHLKLFTLDGLTGISPIQLAYNTVKLGLQSVRFPNSMLENGSQLAGIIKTPKRLDSEGKENIRKGWFQKFHGLDNAGSTAILDEGMDYQQIGINPVDAQLLEIMNLNAEQICSIFGVPQHLAGILAKSTNNNIEHQGIEFLQRLRGHEANVSQELSRKLLLQSELKNYAYRIKLDQIQMADLKARTEYIRTNVSLGIINPNEAREMEERNPYPAGSIYRTNSTNINVSKQDELLDAQIEAYKTKAKPAGEAANTTGARNGQQILMNHKNGVSLYQQ